MSKERIIDFGWNSFSRGVGLAICVGLIYLATGIINQIPCWMGNMWPAVVTHEAWASFRDKDQGAFTLSNEKVRAGEPKDPEFQAEGQNGAFSPRIGLSAHRCRDDNTRIPGPLPRHEIGATWQTRYCFDLPGTLTSGDEIRITGHLVHHRWFGEINEPIPAFTMCAVGASLRDGQCKASS